jgi:uncharacterized coiled-coil DUF342 family protein
MSGLIIPSWQDVAERRIELAAECERLRRQSAEDLKLCRVISDARDQIVAERDRLVGQVKTLIEQRNAAFREIDDLRAAVR